MLFPATPACIGERGGKGGAKKKKGAKPKISHAFVLTKRLSSRTTEPSNMIPEQKK
jgi:hypothetical protein